jgi:hypothetical protein
LGADPEEEVATELGLSVWVKHMESIIVFASNRLFLFLQNDDGLDIFIIIFILVIISPQNIEGFSVENFQIECFIIYTPRSGFDGHRFEYFDRWALYPLL